MKRLSMVPALACAVAACGGGEPADGGADAAPSVPSAAAMSSVPVPPSGPMTIPDWFRVNADAQTVDMTLTSGSTPDNNHWNYNGATKGSMAITVPEGYTVTISLVNDDPIMAHSLGISAQTSDFNGVPEPIAVFEGAITENPASMVDGTMPGETATVTFVADTAGNYSIVCYVPGHSLTGMWILFNVSSDGSVGVQRA